MEGRRASESWNGHIAVEPAMLGEQEDPRG